MNVERTWLYKLAVCLVKFVFVVFFGSRAKGLENFPSDQNCIILGNHIHAFDPLMVAIYYKHNEIHFIGKESLFRNRFIGAFLRKLHAFPVNRGETDMKAMRASMQVLRDGHVLGIFPEGHRQADQQVKSLETGVAVMALRSDVPVVPVYIRGKYRPFGKLRLAVGAPIDLSDLRSGRADMQALETVKSRIMDTLDALKPIADF